MDTGRASGLGAYGPRGAIMSDVQGFEYDSDETEFEGIDDEVEGASELYAWIKNKLDHFQYGQQITESVEGDSPAAKIKRWVISTLNDISAGRMESADPNQAKSKLLEYVNQKPNIRSKNWLKVFHVIKGHMIEFFTYYSYGRIHPVPTIRATQRNMRAR